MSRPRGRPRVVRQEPHIAAPVEPVVGVEAHIEGPAAAGVGAPPLPPPPPGKGDEAGVEGEGPQGGQGGQGPAGIDMTPLVQAIAGAFQAAVAGAQTAAQPRGDDNNLPLERLRSLGDEEFRGSTPERSELWLEKTVRILAQMGCVGARRLGCVISLLQGDAYSWWVTITTGVPEAEIGWDFFESGFRKIYLGPRYLDEKKREFMALAQGDASVTDYEIRFVRLSQYAPELVPTEVERCNRFRYGLNEEIKRYTLASDYSDFDVLVARAKDLEHSLGLTKRSGGSSSGKRNNNFDRGDAKRHRGGRHQFDHRRGGGHHGRGHQGHRRGRRLPECTRCGRQHTGECWGNFHACWNCGSRDHFRRECPHQAAQAPNMAQAPARATDFQRGRGRGRGYFQPRADAPRVDAQRNLAHVVAVQPEVGGPARVYAQREAGNDTDVIAGNFEL
ncbi:hypothetical protein HRI_000014200 [Hibiscus trionum]|uniref:CCHC-type domain-containing protein n=1 Tax=Hibiscus trionum TaxID=183268 RepID=A0A9W7GR92_HIBTR|nr:hypothetical protein HRI_000014200 [Hibiscus trionum]